jgi:hypothetical protein
VLHPAPILICYSPADEDVLSGDPVSGAALFWDANNQLTESSPATLAEGLQAFSLADPVPGVRAEFFDRRGEGTADGNYLSVGVPFGGQLALNRHARLT